MILRIGDLVKVVETTETGSVIGNALINGALMYLKKGQYHKCPPVENGSDQVPNTDIFYSSRELYGIVMDANLPGVYQNLLSTTGIVLRGDVDCPVLLLRADYTTKTITISCATDKD